jgi:hypothetical protein
MYARTLRQSGELLVVLLAGCLALTGCGSTAPLAGSQAVVTTSDGLGAPGAAGAGNGLALPGEGTTSAGSTADGAPLVAVPGSSGIGGESTQGPSLARPDSGSTTAGTADATGSRKPVQVGLMLYPNVEQFAKALGGSAGNAGNQEQIARRMVDWINGRGGLASRKVELVVYNVDLTSAQTYAQIQQEACTHFGEDNATVAVLTVGVGLDNTFPQCLAKYGILNLAGGKYLHDDTDFRQVQNLVAPGEASMAKVGRALVAELTGRGFLKRGDTLGMLTEDAPAGLRTTDDVIIPLLEAKGIKVINYVIEGPTSNADISNSAAAIQSAQLRMATAGVEDVAFMCKGCHGLFVSYAESQSYYPRYFLHSIDGIRAVAGKGKSRSYEGAVALSWDPLTDIGGFSNPEEFTGNPSRDLCRGIMKSYVTDDTSEYITQSFCGGFLDLQAAAKALNGAPVTGANLMAGFDTFGTQHASAVNFATEITPTKHYGAVGYRRMTYRADQDRFVYDDRVLRPFQR